MWIRKAIFAGVSFLMLGAPAHSAKAPKLSKQALALIAMTPEQHADRVTVKDDSLEIEATFDTTQSFQEKFGLLKIVWSDVFLRGFVNKKSGKLRVQVYYHFHGVQPSWPRLMSVNYEAPEGTQTAELDRISSDVDCSSQQLLGGCTFTEDVGFDVDEKLARVIASKYDAAHPFAWKMRFKGQSGLDIDEVIMPAEMAGLLLRVDRYRKEHALEDPLGGF